MTSILEFGSHASMEQDATPPVRAALEAVRADGPGRTLSFPAGTYHFWPDRAEERYVFPSNNDPGLKRIAFSLLGLNDLEIDGGGAVFVFHGRIVPFVLQNCRSVRLRNFSLDWDRTFHNEAEILDAAPGAGGLTRMDLRIPEQFPYQVQHGRLRFTYEGTEPSEAASIGNLLEFDPVRRETAFRVNDNYGVAGSYRAEALEEGIVRLTGAFSTLPTPGNAVSIGGNERECPGIVISSSADVTVSDVTIHHCGGMGVIAQCSENVRLERVRVTPSERDGRLRMISTTADATHFVSCRGLIELIDCLFENQLDDAANIHGIYGRIARMPSPIEIEVEWVHPQQRGLDVFSSGDTLEIVRMETLLTIHQAELSGVERLNSRFCRAILTAPLPPQVKSGDAVVSMSGVADVIIRGCTTRGNRARAFLISSPGRVLLENNHIHSPGAAISIAGDASHWFESGGVRDVTIRGNHFDNCGYGVWGGACIDVCPEIAPEHRAGNDYHRGIRIEGNTFDAFDPRLVRARCVDGLTFRDNTIRPSVAYPVQPGEPFDIEDCRGVRIVAGG